MMSENAFITFRHGVGVGDIVHSTYRAGTCGDASDFFRGLLFAQSRYYGSVHTLLQTS